MIRAALRKLTIGEQLHEEEVFQIISGIRGGEVTEIEIAGFLVALLRKGPTIREVASIARAMRANCEQISPNVDGGLLDTCGTGGGRTTFNCSTAAAIVAAAAGIPVAKHGSRSLASASGSADVLEKLGVVIDLTPKQAERLIETVGIGFLYAPNFHPVMHKVLRRKPPWGSRRSSIRLSGAVDQSGGRQHILGSTSPNWWRWSPTSSWRAPVQARAGGSRIGRGWTRSSVIGKTSLAEVKDGWAKSTSIAGRFRLRTPYEELTGGTAQENADLLRAIFAGEERGARRDMVLANAAAGLLVGGKAADLPAGVRLAAELIDSGAAGEKLDDLVAESNRIASSGA